MFQSVSWSQYFTYITIATILYYLFIWIFYFKGKFSSLPGVAHLRRLAYQGEDSPDEVIGTAQHVMDELRPVFTRAITKNELLYALRLKLQKYNGWEEPAFRDAVTTFILRESQSKCSIRLDEEDRRALWLQA
jgi:hypothetical protein